MRRATPADLGDVLRLSAHVQGWHAAMYPDRFHARPDPVALAAHFEGALADPETTILLSGDPPAAYALCTLRNRAESAFSPAIRRLTVEHVATDPAQRRQGHARALFEELRRRAHEAGCAEIVLDTWAANVEAHAFFRAMGFAPQRHLFARAP